MDKEAESSDTLLRISSGNDAGAQVSQPFIAWTLEHTQALPENILDIHRPSSSLSAHSLPLFLLIFLSSCLSSSFLPFCLLSSSFAGHLPPHFLLILLLPSCSSSSSLTAHPPPPFLLTLLLPSCSPSSSLPAHPPPLSLLTLLSPSCLPSFIPVIVIIITPVTSAASSRQSLGIQQAHGKPAKEAAPHQ